MLVLSRKQNQIIHIGNGITIRVLTINGNRVRIGVIAPRDQRVDRGELRQLGQQEPPIARAG